MGIVNAGFPLRGPGMALFNALGSQAFIDIPGAGGQIQNSYAFAYAQLLDGFEMCIRDRPRPEQLRF